MATPRARTQFYLYRLSAQETLAGIGKPENWRQRRPDPTRQRPFVHRIHWTGTGWAGPERDRRRGDSARLQEETLLRGAPVR